MTPQTTTETDMDSTLFASEETSELTPAIEDADATENPAKTRARAPRTRSKALAASVRAEASPEVTTVALERLHAQSSSAAVQGLRRNIELIDARMRDTTPKHPRDLEGHPTWLRHTGKLLRARAGAAFRLRWLEARRESGVPLPFAEPTNADLIRQLAKSARFSTLDRVGLISATMWTSSGPNCAGLHATQGALATLRWKASQTMEAAYTGVITNSKFPGWAQIEARSALQLKRETELVERITRFNRLPKVLGDGCWTRIQACRAEFTDDVLVQAWFASHDPGRAKPELDNHEIRQIRKVLGELEVSVKASLPPGPQRDEMLATLSASHKANLDRAIERLRQSHEQMIAPYRADARAQCLYATTEPRGWRTIGEVADRNPHHFPTGFADRWLACVTDSMLEIGPDVLVELLDAA